MRFPSRLALGTILSTPMDSGLPVALTVPPPGRCTQRETITGPHLRTRHRQPLAWTLSLSPRHGAHVRNPAPGIFTKHIPTKRLY